MELIMNKMLKSSILALILISSTTYSGRNNTGTNILAGVAGLLTIETLFLLKYCDHFDEGMVSNVFNTALVTGAAYSAYKDENQVAIALLAASAAFSLFRKHREGYLRYMQDMQEACDRDKY